MFRRLRAKIIASVVVSVTLVFLVLMVTVNVISFNSQRAQSREMLERYAGQYGMKGGEKPADIPQDRKGPPPDQGARMFDLSTFYSVLLAEDGSVTDADNGGSGTVTKQRLEELAKEIYGSGKTDGSYGSLDYVVRKKGGSTLVAFIDTTVSRQNTRTLMISTALAGLFSVAALFVVFFFMSGKMVLPLEENDRKQRQFVSDAGHELKTPIAVISANTELLSREYGESVWLSNVRYETERMGTLVTQLLDLSHAENAQMIKERVDLGRLITGEVLPFESVAFERGLTLETDVADGVYVKGEPSKLSQLIAILTDNAIRHSSGGAVGIALKQVHKNAVVTVVNEGDEIPPDKAARLFERFYRVDEVRNGEDRHYGLGLAIAKAIADAHDGSIEVASGGGKVIFTVTLPVDK